MSNNALKESYLYKVLASKVHQCMSKVNPRIEMRRAYKVGFNREPDFENPKDLIEKIFWLQLNTDTTLWTKCADKYRMREYVSECGLSDYLPKLVGHWDTAEDLSIEGLPSSFILKTNHGCETCFIVRDGQCDIEEIKKVFEKWLSIPFGYSGGQLHYTHIKPCIIAEELLIPSEQDKKISPNSLIDYKVYCFNGKPEAIWVAYNRMHGGVNMALYDLNWNAMPEKLVSGSYYKFNPDVAIPKPACLDEMLNLASILSKPFPEVRCDFYVINDRPYIGELTFTSGFPFFTQEFYNYLGSKILLPEKKQ